MTWHWALVTLIVLWIVGVISFAIWLYKMVIPDVQKLLTESDLTEIEKSILLSKVMHPPRFRKD
jgi:hypothetical protein